ncbi:hypothetical protein RHSIM_Rhsim10G0005900 [Rhododendron simsii]|uniref:peroxidase n=1 Tax=Rhododendron simsii TaxID=118357 RepID=A0A834GB81_RHOSS|nr:hypothetical protein RHSIM_Rhsim10G0005900 [Rhododendron simsii]
MVVSKASAYEESRLKRLEENKKRMEELNLNKLAQALSTPKSSPVCVLLGFWFSDLQMKRVKPKVPRQPVDLSAVRRSSRVADKPPTSYKEEPIEPLGRARRSYSFNRTNLANRVYASAEGRAYAIDRAEALQSGLESKFPSFGLPVQFCEKHLPSHDEFIALLDEDDNESPTKYLADKRGLSAGWRGFAIDHELVDGDALVFQLIEPTKFKVYIIRVNQVEDDDEAPNVTEVEAWKGLCVAVVIILVVGGGEGQLSENFYSLSCPNVESIVNQTVFTKFTQTIVTIPATLRLFFHDCMVELSQNIFKGLRFRFEIECFCCDLLVNSVGYKEDYEGGADASIMISSPNGDAEKDAPDNLSLAGDGFDTVIKAKAAVEAVCPGVVSCADILAVAARDVVVLAGGLSFKVELGRRDGLISKASEVAANLPDPSFNLSQLIAVFAKKNLTQDDLITLSGAHTIGHSHCSRFANRLYNFSLSSKVDPSMNPNYAQQLMQACPQNVDPRIAVDLDPVTPEIFDNVYYQNLLVGKGLLTSDEVLFTNPASRRTVKNFANNPSLFNSEFGNAMIKLGRVGVKTGNQGQIRKDCTAFNS